MIPIMHVISDLDAGGAEAMLAKLVAGLDRVKFRNLVVSMTDRGQLAGQIEAAGAEVHTLGMTRGRPALLPLFRLRSLLKWYRPMIVQSWLYHADLLGTVAAKTTGVPFLIWNIRCSDMDLTEYSPLTRLTQRMLGWLSGMPSAIVSNSESGRRVHERMGYRPREWVLIPNGFDTQRFRPDHEVRQSLRRDWGVLGDEVVVALVARVDPMKDHSTFLEAARQVVQAGRCATFLLIGKGTDSLSSAVIAKGLKGSVRLLGYREDVDRLLPGIDVACLSSAFGEGFPNVLGEAMACAIPCVSTDVGDAGSIIGDTGLVVPVRNPTALAQALQALIDCGPAERERLGRAARQRIETQYALSRVVEQYADLYSGLALATSSPTVRGLAL